VTPSPVEALEYGFADSVNRFLANLGSNAPLATLAEVAAINREDAANRVPYGQGYITGSVNTAITAQQYAAIVSENQETAAHSLRHLFDTYQLDGLIVGLDQSYAAAGFPAITVPNGLSENGQPSGLTIIGDFLGEPNLIAIAYAYEQGVQGRVEPDLDKTLADIEAMLAGK
ncbi:MAG: hypothetical protein KDE50_15525, partial [Caldilineaceae bacterium]|nr:hypothetical protein [Caldilineaceae bacterium]